MDPQGGANRFADVTGELAAIVNKDRELRKIVCDTLATGFGSSSWRHVAQYHKNIIMSEMEAKKSTDLRDVIENGIAGHSPQTAEGYVR